MAEVSERDAKNGQFLKGKSGNPAGRPLGSKNRILKAKQDLEVLLREDIVNADDIRAVWNAMLLEAKTGNVSAGKLILDKVISQATAAEDDDNKSGGITVHIKNLTLPGSEDQPVTVEGEFTEE